MCDSAATPAPGEPELAWVRDPKADAAYVHLTDAEIVRTVCAGPSVNFDVDWTGRPVGIEVLGSHDWTAALVALFLRGEVRLVHGFDDENPVPAAAAVRGRGAADGDERPDDRGYRPFHATDCPARDSRSSPDHCTCGGLSEAVWKPGDAPSGAADTPSLADALKASLTDAAARRGAADGSQPCHGDTCPSGPGMHLRTASCRGTADDAELEAFKDGYAAGAAAPKPGRVAPSPCGVPRCGILGAHEHTIYGPADDGGA